MSKTSTLEMHTPIRQPTSFPTYARRPTRAQFEYPKASQQPAEIVQPLQSLIWLASPTQYRPSSSLVVGNATSACKQMPSTHRHGYFCPLPSAVPAPPTLVAAAPSLETAPYSNNTPQGFYTIQELEAHFPKVPEHVMPCMPLFTPL